MINMLDLRSGGQESSLWLYRTRCFLPRGCTPRNYLWKCAARFSEFWTYFRGKKRTCSFPHRFSVLASKPTLVFRPGLKDLYIVCQPNGELKQRRRRRQRERQKSNRVLSPKQQLCTSHAFLYISLLSLHDYAVKLPNFTFRGGRERTKTIFFFFF